ncbi:MAG: hypothetical protein ACI8W8_003749 [Rhodothermales bacterium]|jgi:hypothetical protein
MTIALFIALLLVDMLGIRVGPAPFSLLVLAAIVLQLYYTRRDKLAGFSWLQVGILATAALGLYALTPEMRNDGLREWIQLVAVFGGCWWAAAALRREEREGLTVVFAGVAGMLLGVGGNTLPLSPARLGLLLALTCPFLVHYVLGRKLDWVMLTAAGALVALQGNAGLTLAALAGMALAAISAKRRDAWKRCCGCFAAAGVVLFYNAAALDTLSYHHADGHPKRLLIEMEASLPAIQEAAVTGHGLGRYKTVIHDYFQQFPDADDNKILPDTNSTYAMLAVESGPLAAIVLLLGLLGMAAAAWRSGNRLAASALVALIISGFFTTIVTRNTGMTVGCILGLASGFGVLPIGHTLLRGGLVALAGVACLALPRANSTKPDAPQIRIIERGTAESADFVVVEAEMPLLPPTGVMAIAPANDASGNRALAVSAGKGKGEGIASYRFEGLEPVEYTVWVRVLWQDGCGNSIGLVAGDRRMIVTDERFGRWHWLSASRRLTPQDGKLEFALHNLEDGIKIDQIVVTPDAGFEPYGVLRAPKLGDE